MSELHREAIGRPPHSKEHLYLATDLYAAEVDGGAILLDLRSLQYYALDPPSLPSLRKYVFDWPRPSDLLDDHESMAEVSPSILDPFYNMRFLSTRRPDKLFSSGNMTPRSACHPIWTLRANSSETFLMLYRLASAYLRTAAYLRARRLRALLTKLDHPPRTKAKRPPAPSQEYIVSLITLYAKLRVWFYTAKGHCLLDSLVLLTVLRGYDIPATITIGVAPKPFSAHAWVQVHDCVLDDSIEHVREFTPILVA